MNNETVRMYCLPKLNFVYKQLGLSTGLNRFVLRPPYSDIDIEYSNVDTVLRVYRCNTKVSLENPVSVLTVNVTDMIKKKHEIMSVIDRRLPRRQDLCNTNTGKQTV